MKRVNGSTDEFCVQLPLVEGASVSAANGGSPASTRSIRIDPSDKVFFKYIVDGVWRCSGEFPTESDSNGNVNNWRIPAQEGWYKQRKAKAEKERQAADRAAEASMSNGPKSQKFYAQTVPTGASAAARAALSRSPSGGRSSATATFRPINSQREGTSPQPNGKSPKQYQTNGSVKASNGGVQAPKLTTATTTFKPKVLSQDQKDDAKFAQNAPAPNNTQSKVSSNGTSNVNRNSPTTFKDPRKYFEQLEKDFEARRTEFQPTPRGSRRSTSPYRSRG